MQKIQLPRKPVYKKIELDEDFITFFYRVEQNFESCFLLESLGSEYDSRYSILGFAPKHILRGRENVLYFDDEAIPCQNPYYHLREIIPTDILSRIYSGGLVGYISYEGMNYFEPSLQLPQHEDFDTFLFGLYLDGLVLDTMTAEVYYFYYEQDRIDEILALTAKTQPEPSLPDVEFLGYSMSDAQHRAAVEEAIEEIKSGNTFQCQVGFKAQFSIRGNLFPIYEELRRVNPSPHMFYFKQGEQKIIGASPELLFRLRNGEMETYPLAGSIRRGRDQQEDIAMARKLLNDAKEIAEHNMLVDLHRNDLGRVARYGTVKIRRLMDIKKYSHIQHISSEVTGMISREEDMFSGLASNFPAGTLSGAPKIESMKIIRRLEQNPRGPYGGALGHFGLDGNCTFAIPIRSLFISGEKAYSQASGGVVYDSTPENEYDEVMRKSQAMASVLAKFTKEKN